MEDKDIMNASEPAAALLSEDVRRSGLLGRIMGLSKPDKVALMNYLRQDTNSEEFFKSDESGRIMLTKQMRKDLLDAGSEYEVGNCLSESDFKERFEKWL